MAAQGDAGYPEITRLILHASLHPRAGATGAPTGKEEENGASLEKESIPTRSEARSIYFHEGTWYWIPE